MSDEDIREIRKDIAEIKNSISKMDNHIDFIDSVYKRISPMLNFLTFRYNTEVSSRKTLQHEEFQMIDCHDVISESDRSESDRNDQIPKPRQVLLPVIAGVSAIAAVTLFTVKRS